MAENSKIEWTDHTFNPVVGCQKVGPGCDNCYAEALAKRTGMVEWGEHAERRVTSDQNWKQPLKWNRRALEQFGRPARVFCASMSDWADKKWPLGVRERLFGLIRETPNLIWLLLTKRIGNVPGMLPADWGDGYPNVCLMATVVNQDEADRDVRKLLNVPARWRGLSMEPLLGDVNLKRLVLLAQAPGSYRAGVYLDCLNGEYPNSGLAYVGDWDIDGPCPPDSERRKIDWVICGGESGPRARHMDPAWALSIRNQCHAASIPFFMKQMTGKAPIPDDLMVRQTPFEQAAAEAA